MLESAAQIIDSKGGAAVVAVAVGKQPGAVRLWKHRNCFPREAWPELIQAYEDLTLERLIALERAQAAARRPVVASDPEQPAPALDGAAA